MRSHISASTFRPLLRVPDFYFGTKWYRVISASPQAHRRSYGESLSGSTVCSRILRGVRRFDKSRCISITQNDTQLWRQTTRASISSSSVRSDATAHVSPEAAPSSLKSIANQPSPNSRTLLPQRSSCFPVDNWAVERLGDMPRCLTLEVTAWRKGILLRGDTVVERSQIAEKFMQQMVGSPGRGLFSWASATLGLRRCIPKDLGFSITAQFHGPRPPGDEFGNYALVARGTGQFDDNPPGIKLTLPCFHGVEWRGSEARHSSTTWRRAFVSLDGILEPNRLQDAQESPSSSMLAVQEVKFQTEMADRVIGHICSQMTFENDEAALSAISQALLQVLQFNSPLISLQRITLQVDLAPTDPAQRKTVTAHWSDQQVGSSTESKGTRRVVISFKKSSDGKPEQQEDASSEDAAEASAILGSSSPSPVPPRATQSPMAPTSNTISGSFGVVQSRNPSNSDSIFVALGSNVGMRFEAIEAACRTIDESENMRVLETSPLYETDPMYVEDQARFLNGVCKIETELPPMELLDALQTIENGLGRVKLIDKGPRNIDLDIVSYHDRTMESERLIIPHKLMLEREFVLRPICETSGKDFVHPKTGRKLSQHLADLPSSTAPIYPLTPLSPDSVPLRSIDPKRRTRLMSILNVTPDSFSDGGANTPTNLSALKATITSHIACGATIIDIGGQSSRPNAPDVTAEEELARILPAIEIIKSLSPEECPTPITISIDTYRASVAEGAIKAGAHVINDISAGTLDKDMLPTIAHLGCTYIMMHMRGTPATMQNPENTTYPERGLIVTIATELRERLAAAQAAGIRRWRIILDPGIGFAKSAEQNIELLRDFGDLRYARGLETYPWLVGSSRKRFIGQATGEGDAKKRAWGTAATITAAVHGGADIVRVHDVAEMAQVVKMADAMYRGGIKAG